MSRVTFFVIAGLLLGVVASSAQPRRALTVSPGEEGGASLIAQTCPSFSWGALPGVDRWELAVYKLPEDELADESEPQISLSVPGSALSWSPALSQCLEAGYDYVWFVRAVDAYGEGEWSEGRAFRIASTPSAEEVTRAFDVLRRYLADSPPSAHMEAAFETAGALRQRTGSPQAEDLASDAASSFGPNALIAGITAIRGEIATTSGVTYGVQGISNSSSGAGLAGDNTAGGPDLVLGGADASLAMSEAAIDVSSAAARTFDIRNSGGGGMTLKVDGMTVFHSGNDGQASGLHADLLDGQEGSFYLDWDNLTNLPGGFADGVDNVGVTGVVAGSGLSGGGTSGSVTLSADTSFLDLRYLNVGEAHNHSTTEITSGTLSTDRFSAYTDLQAEGRLDANSVSDVLLLSQADSRYLNVGESHNHSASQITSGVLSTSRFDAWADLQSAGRLDNNFSTDLLTQAQSDGRYLRSGDNARFYGCGGYVPANFCPAGNTTIGPNCDDVPAGSYCEADGECGLSTVGNCGAGAWYFKRNE